MSSFTVLGTSKDGSVSPLVLGAADGDSDLPFSNIAEVTASPLSGGGSFVIADISNDCRTLSLGKAMVGA